ncbi:thioesterase II family protein [Mycobacterium deserti]|uniref:Thioesterase TesA n=1 Tax=Mycobacterium deserti TaxID=2978347 RepID=A0ABT2MFC2_9MYCO|nr:alpha/beta fold hydrolase [Mycobacterium deserti]MCT7659805.1 alpha/beta fold hydrolase [Mycobacterium deserti]
MARKLGWIRQFHKPAGPDSPPLLVFPHAGAGASAYREFSKVLSAKFNVLVFQYPGRQDRAGEALLGTLPEIASGAFDEFSTSEHIRRGPLVVFGHSMGALVAFEFVRIAEAAGVDVRQLNVAATVAPHLAAAKPSHPKDDESLLNHLSALEGTDAGVMGNRELMMRTLPVVRADFSAVDVYSCPDDVKVCAPIHAMGGEQDVLITLADLYGWSKHTDDFKVTMFEGGHFFVNQHVEAVADLLVPGAMSGQIA